MKAFMDKDFLLSTETAKELYHNHAAKMPVIDYHCHISPAEIYEDHKFKNITEAWLGGDHYKWRAIRAMGAPEELVTGNGDDKEKFKAFAKMLESAIGNPLYPWTHLELQRYFGYYGALNEETADEVWTLCNEKLKTADFSVRRLIERSGVEVICSTDDPADSLEYHKRIREDKSFQVKVLPAWRPDKAMNINAEGFGAYIEKLSEVSGVKITDFESLCKALSVRMDFFDEMGCRASDHSLSGMFFKPADQTVIDGILKNAMNGKAASDEEVMQYHTELLRYLGREYARRDWVMQLHMSVLRNTNTRAFRELGADTGYDCIASAGDPRPLTEFLNDFEKDGLLPKTILYSLNPNDNTAIDSVIGCFQGPGVKMKIQHGAAWWFNDTEMGMRDQLKSLASCSLLGGFIGMLTDSRSFLSYTRHEYFRRILCDVIGEYVERGEYPKDMKVLGKMVEDISYNNCKAYFGF